MERIARSSNFKCFLLILLSLSFVNSYENRVNSEILKNNPINEIDFETALNQNSVQFHEYENPKFLFDDFFGLDDPLNQSSSNTNFQDLSLQIDSKNLRDIYRKKLLEMAKTDKKNEESKVNWSFFNKKI